MAIDDRSKESVICSHRSNTMGVRVERAFMSKQEEKVNILIRFGIFYLLQ